MDDCINCKHCTWIDKDNHSGLCKLHLKNIFVQIDGCDDFEWSSDS